jgi:hypothetical protein
MVARLFRPHQGAFALVPETAPGISLSPAPGISDETRVGKPVRTRHSARHARGPEGGSRPSAALPIRSAERRRRAAELSGSALSGSALSGSAQAGSALPDSAQAAGTATGLVIHGAGGIGKSGPARRAVRARPPCRSGPPAVPFGPARRAVRVPPAAAHAPRPQQRTRPVRSAERRPITIAACL